MIHLIAGKVRIRSADSPVISHPTLYCSLLLPAAPYLSLLLPALGTVGRGIVRAFLESGATVGVGVRGMRRTAFHSIPLVTVLVLVLYDVMRTNGCARTYV